MMAEKARITRTGSPRLIGSFSGSASIKVFSIVPEGQPFEKPEDAVASRKTFQSSPGVPQEFIMQPPAAPAATEAASVHLSRWAPHPSTDTSPGTEPSPRMPAMLTVPPRQKQVDEATSVKAVELAADPSSLPVAELVSWRAAPPWRKTWSTGQDFICTGVNLKEGKGRGNQVGNTRSLLGGGSLQTPSRRLVAKRVGLR
jgi:hypothetical protein